MVAYLDANPDVGVIGPHTLNSDGTTSQHGDAFRLCCWLSSRAPGCSLMRRSRLLDRFYVRDAPDDAVIDVDWVQGSALMLRREVYARLADWMRVMSCSPKNWTGAAGPEMLAGEWSIWGRRRSSIMAARARIRSPHRKHIHFQQSKLRYFRKYHGRAIAHILRFHLLGNYAGQLGLEALKSLLGSQRQLRRERIRAYWQVIRSGLKVT
jgi:N-acetylglucosaminyl-diphospho-decaprenol L-rhamnosyltransferase